MGSRVRVSQPQRAVKWAILLGAIAIVVYLCARILGPFLDVIAWSVVIAIAFYPVYRRILAQTHRPAFSALMSSLLVVVTTLVPLLFVAGLVVNELIDLRNYLQRTFEGGVDLTVSGPAQQLSDWLMRTAHINIAQVADVIAQHASELGAYIAEYSLAIATNLTSAALSFVFTMFALFFLFRDGSRIAGRIPDFIPFERTQSEQLLTRIGDVIHASVYGVLVVAIAQGVMIGLAFAALGIPSALLWGVVTMFSSLLPVVGSASVWIPGALYLLLTGSWLKAVFLVAWGVVVVSSVDNFLRPVLIGERVGLSELVIFFSVLGGLQVFGVLGIILGPVLFAVATSLIDALSEGTVADSGR